MSGASELSNLLATLEPELSASEVVFCHFPGVSFEDKPPFRSLGAFDEREGLTLIVSRSEAEMHGLPFETVLRAITLNVRSRLEAVGLIAPKAELEGRQALFVVNLAPRTMAGQISEAMLLDIGYADGVTPVLAVPERPIPSGVRAG